MPRVADRLHATRQRRFIGRETEQNLLASALQADELPFYVLHVYGPGGVGKTTLLNQYARQCEQAGVPSTYFDARNVEPTVDAFTGVLSMLLGLPPTSTPAEIASKLAARHVILIDTYELLAPLDNWLRDVFLPQLPETVLVVLAGRQPPSSAWRADPGWQPFVRFIPLRNLSPDEGRTFLSERNVPSEQLSSVLAFTHSHPLAMSLVADLFDQRPGFKFQPDAAPDVIKTLVEQFLQRVPGPAHRRALEACSLIRVTTESMLAEMLAMPDSHELFEWLRDLSFVEFRPGGVFPHDLAREALTADLRWRNPDWYAELHRRARVFYTNRLQQTHGQEQQLALFDLVYLHRDNPIVRPFFEWQTSGRSMPDRLRNEDVPALRGMVLQHESEESAVIFQHWLASQPNNVIVFRNPDGQPAGFMIFVSLAQLTAQDKIVDPAVAAAADFLQQNTPLRSGETATYFRFWMASDSYQGVSPTQSLIFINMVRHYFSPGLAYTFYACADPDFWLPVFSYAELSRLPALDFELGWQKFGVYGHDWRLMPPLKWLDLLGQREIAAQPDAAMAAPQTDQLVVLNEDLFAEAVMTVLRDFTRPDLLRGTPLLRSRLVVERVSNKASDVERVVALQTVFREAATVLQGSPKDLKLYRALHHTYFQPASTQEQAAELLDLPFSTYRRHLKSAVLRMTEILWAQELGGAEK